MKSKKIRDVLGTTIMAVLVGILNIYLVDDQLYGIYVLLVGIPMAVVLSHFLFTLFAEDATGKMEKAEGEKEEILPP